MRGTGWAVRSYPPADRERSGGRRVEAEMRYRRRYCSYCDRKVLALQHEPAIIVHAALIVMTCGFWLPVFLFVVLKGTWVCKYCGKHL